jgi:general secretion pathway protein G
MRALVRSGDRRRRDGRCECDTGESIRRSKEAVLREDLYEFRMRMNQYIIDKHSCTKSLADFVAAGYMKQVPVEPFTRRSDMWVTTTSPAGCVTEVHIGSREKGCDGTRYDT